MGTQLLHREELPNGEELIVTSLARDTDGERTARIAAYKEEVLRVQREIILARLPEGHTMRGVMLNIPTAEAAPDLQGVCSFTDVALPRPA
jgi:hypothetical protein